MSYDSSLVVSTEFTIAFEDPIVVACTNSELIDVGIQQLWTRANYYNATYFLFPEIQDTGSLALGDSTGISYCGEKSYALQGGSGFI